MLDDENADGEYLDFIEAADPDEPEEAEAPVAAEEPEFLIEIEGAEPDPDEEIAAELGDKGRSALKAVRDAQKKTAAKLRETEAELAKLREASTPKPQIVPEPTLEECNWNEGVFKQRMSEHLASVAEQEKTKSKQAEEEKAAQDDYTKRMSNYTARKAEMKVADFDDAEAAVRSALTVQQQSVIVRAASDPAAVVLALGKNPKILQELAAVRDIDRFAYELAKTEGKIKVTQKTPPPVESKITGGLTGAPIGAQPLDEIYKQASRTGDYTKYFAEKKRRGIKA